MTKIWSEDPLFGRQDIVVLKKGHYLEVLIRILQFKSTYSVYWKYTGITTRSFAINIQCFDWFLKTLSKLLFSFLYLIRPFIGILYVLFTHLLKKKPQCLSRSFVLRRVPTAKISNFTLSSILCTWLYLHVHTKRFNHRSNIVTLLKPAKG